MGDIALPLGDGVMRNGCGVGAAVATLGYGVSGVTARGGGVVLIGRGVGGASMGGGHGDRGITEGARIVAGSVGVAMDVEKSRRCRGLLATVCRRD